MLNTKCFPTLPALFKALPLCLFLALSSSPSGAQLPIETAVASYTTGITTATVSDSPHSAPVGRHLVYHPALLSAPTVPLHPKGRKFIGDYLEKNEEDLRQVKKRSAYYFSTIESIFRAKGLPAQMKYLAVIESELRTTAVSRVGATGMWQLMPGTARELGLKVSKGVDERRHFVKSTRAAAKYIKGLHAQFDDWLLVIAAYNCGAGNVMKAIKKGGSRDFWTIERFLPAETRAHVKRYIGAHYYFHGTGSLATLTRHESASYLKALREYEEAMEVLEEIAREQVEESAVVAATVPAVGR